MNFKFYYKIDILICFVRLCLKDYKTIKNLYSFTLLGFIPHDIEDVLEYQVRKCK